MRLPRELAHSQSTDQVFDDSALEDKDDKQKRSHEACIRVWQGPRVPCVVVTRHSRDGDAQQPKNASGTGSGQNILPSRKNNFLPRYARVLVVRAACRQAECAHCTRFLASSRPSNSRTADGPLDARIALLTSALSYTQLQRVSQVPCVCFSHPNKHDATLITPRDRV